MRELWAHAGFARFWLARLAGVAASQMLMLAIGWHMYELTGSAWDLGLVGLYQFAPAVVLTLAAGHAADRVHRARLAALCLAIQVGLSALMLAGTLGHWISRELLLGVSIMLGALRPFQMAAHQSLISALVPTSLLARATAFSSAGIQVAVIGGPALGGAIFVFGTAAVYASCAVLFMLASLMFLMIRYERVIHPPEPVSMDTLLAGVRFIWRSPVLLGASALDLFAVLLGGATALLPIFAKEILHVGPAGLGLLRAAPAVGALIVGVALSRWPLARRVGGKLLWAVAGYGVCMVVFGLSTHFLLSLLVLGLSGGFDMVSVVIRQTVLQLETPDAMRGRVSAANSLFIGASNQLGEFESGVTAAWWGPVGAVVVGGLGTVAVAALWLKAFPALARRDRLSGD